MSAEAQARLQQVWEKLHFAHVKRTIARDPEDVLSIDFYKDEGSWPSGLPKLGHLETDSRRYRRVSDVPESLRHRASVAWRHYYGFTEDGIYFQKDDYHGLDLDIDLTMTWSRWGNHTGGWERPEDGQLICGEVIETAKGKRFTKWFVCDEAFRLLVEVIRGDVMLGEEELGRRLLTDDYPDKFWAIVRLVLFDNVQAFVDECKLTAMRWDSDADRSFARHPAAGMVYGKHGFECGERGMYLAKNTSEFVHLMSHRFDHPQWWQEFLCLTSEQGVAHNHPGLGGFCEACDDESRKNADFYDDYRTFLN